jgi:biopolymer transport protein ExbB/TolQ
MENYSLATIFRDAGSVEIAVMSILGLASLLTWIIIIEKSIIISQIGRQIKTFIDLARSLDDDNPPEGFPGFTAQMIAEAGLKESLDHAGGETRADFRERIERSMRLTLAFRLKTLETRVPILATVGSTSPFVGLFGTVWGIMLSFIGITEAGDTTLSAVAPGIASALSATAMGLVAAIPAVVAYNAINNSIKKITSQGLTGISLIGNALARFHFSKLEKKKNS